MRLAIKIARQHQRNGIELEDLIATAAGATLDAIRVFDASKGANFPTVARQWMIARCQEVVKSRGVVSGDDRTTRELYRKIHTARRVLTAQGVDITPETIADHLKLDADKIADAWPVVFNSATSLSTPVGHSDGSTFGDLLSTREIRQDEKMDRTRKSERIASAIAEFSDSLSLRDRHIFESRNLAEFLGKDALSQAVLAEINGISIPRVCQISKALNRKCAEFLTNKGLTP